MGTFLCAHLAESGVCCQYCVGGQGQGRWADGWMDGRVGKRTFVRVCVCLCLCVCVCVSSHLEASLEADGSPCESDRGIGCAPGAVCPGSLATARGPDVCLPVDQGKT